ncbi:hypothetical protein BWGOE4_22090 [Bacillus mycoides]|uniref:DUF1656 domain-containing protein n=2 Tax=Bacillus cereus group TaxID=86661 RepID=J8AKV0_BACCE|nr:MULTISPECIES: hypothetical protein [Bacillus cereus group]EJQ43742.1 hypothetical protein IEE_02973 [Bacillus cereus BAG5X1-1]EJV62635.1 hypothetical protein IEM_03093 [Bacillus cereus BAG6O-2]MBJ8006631.1 hypothetical protein [Bacillus cereus]MBJ8072633.1 hypothetical protein [Bacillus cereus]MBJ8187910.1 hypothetical protein [Bacillus cereus]
MNPSKIDFGSIEQPFFLLILYLIAILLTLCITFSICHSLLLNLNAPRWVAKLLAIVLTLGVAYQVFMNLF